MSNPLVIFIWSIWSIQQPRCWEKENFLTRLVSKSETEEGGRDFLIHRKLHANIFFLPLISFRFLVLCFHCAYFTLQNIRSENIKVLFYQLDQIKYLLLEQLIIKQYKYHKKYYKSSWEQNNLRPNLKNLSGGLSLSRGLNMIGST